ncbi:MAG TPA: hypothetical protein VMV68_10785 [Spirochaetia bacterium]|nr:hypothetical protein [Spirochaetia bacterium]
MIRIAKQTEPEKLAELKKKINDKEYLDFAIRKIAQVLTNEIMQQDEENTNHRIG